MSDYATVVGSVQFEPKNDKVAGKNVKKITVRSSATQKLVYVTLWPTLNNTDVKKGDFVMVDGRVNEFGDNIGIDATTIFVGRSVSNEGKKQRV